MTYDPTQHPINQPRRKDRTVNDPAWIESYLQHAPYGVLATSNANQPFAHTNLFVYDPARRAIYFHTYREGRTRYNIGSNPPVCFTVSQMGRLLPADTALEFSVEYASVVVFGRVQVVEDEEEASCGLQLLLDKYFPHLHSGQDYRPIQPDELARTAVYRLDIESWSGKRKAVAEDFPGAFRFGEKDGG